MRILIVNDHSEISGVNTFIVTLITIAKRKYKNIDFWLFVPEIGRTSLSVKLDGLCTTVSVFPRTVKFDLILFNNDLQYLPTTVESRFIVHGLMYEGSIPRNKYNKVICFSKRAYNYIEHQNKILVNNGIDLKKFKSKKINREPEKILIFDTRNNHITNNIITEAVKDLPHYVKGAPFPPVWDIEKFLNKADISIAYGRCAIESMAVGLSTIIFGINGGEGVVTENNFYKFAETNFSGWNDKKIPLNFNGEAASKLREEILKYDRKSISRIRDLVREEYDMEKIIDKIIQ